MPRPRIIHFFINPSLRSRPQAGTEGSKNQNTMPILIKPVQRVDPSNPTGAKKWYIVQTTTRQVDETEVAMELSDETTLNASEAMMAIRQLRKIVIRHLKAGESVKLGNWGSFNLSLSTQGAETKEELTANNIKNVNINFQPDDEFKAELQKAQFVWVDKLAAGRGNAEAGGITPSGPDDDETTGGGTDDGDEGSFG